MDFSVQGGDTLFGSSVTVIIVLLILLLQLRERKVRPLGLVLMPVLMLCVTAGVVYLELGAGPVAWAMILVGFSVGVGAGLLIAARTQVKIGADGRILMKGSILAVGIWAAIILLKIYGKDLVIDTGLLDINLLTTALLAMTLGTMIARRGYLFYRYMQLKKASETATPEPVIENKK